MRIASEIFREYDIRGIYGKDLTGAVAGLLGRAIGTFLREQRGRRIVVGRDCRSHGQVLEEALVDGLRSTGCEVLTIGVTPTPVNYWSIRHLGADGGVQITGSHNPPEYNGVKLTLMGKSLYGEDIQALRHIIERGAFASGQGEAKPAPVLDAYVAELTRNLRRPDRRLKVVVDAGNGTGGITAVPLYQALGYDVVPLFCDMDGSFPNHHPDPTVEENLEDLKAAVREHQADVGIAFDGDGDRIGVVDKNGEVVWGDRLMILLSRDVLREEKGATIIGEVKCSKTLYDDVKRHGGTAIMWKTGHSLIKEKMKASNAALAGEMSGHIFFKHRYYGFDDAAYAGGRLLEILSHGKGTIAERLADVPRMYATPEIRVDCPESLKFELVRRAVQSFRARGQREGFEVIDIDGARLEWSDGWGLVRCSNTQPLLVMRFEAQSEARAHEVRKLMDGEIARLREELGG